MNGFTKQMLRGGVFGSSEQCMPEAEGEKTVW